MKKAFVKYFLTTITALAAIPLVLILFSELQETEIGANIHKIERAPSPYLYQYDTPTFDLYAGEDSNSPNFKVTQVKRSLEFKVATDPNPSPLTSIVKSNNRGFLENLLSVVASQSVKVINESTDPAIEYEKVNGSTDFLLKPDQEKLSLTWELLADQNLPKLEFKTEGLIPRKEGSSIIFYTPTFRKAFELQSANLTHRSGAQPVDLSLSRSHTDYNITFDINTSVVFPSSLSVSLVSLFHERLIEASPTQTDFSALEKPEFLINTSQVDEPLRSALINKDYTSVKFGVIDADGKGHQVPAELLDSNGDLILRFTNDGLFKPGLYDLLVQYKNNPSFIGTEEFSWGVLAMNPDQSVYKSGQKAKIDIAVLDHLGRIVCDANLEMKIENPSGNTTNLSTKGGQIKSTPGCSIKETDLPDYTTVYQSSGEGEYLVTLSAETQNGQYTIKDKFIVNDSSPYYVKRTGPTRIYPPSSYDMRLEIEANKDASKIIERVPADFTILDPGDFVKDDNHNLVWKGSLKKGKTLTFYYEFKTPNISPALYILGPVKINDWQEPRDWQLALDDTAVRTFTFSTDAEGWTYTDDQADCSGTRVGSGGNPGGALETTGSKSGGSVTCNTYWEWSGDWEDLNVNPGDNVTAIDGSYDYDVTDDSSGGTWDTGTFELRDGGGTLRETIVTALTGQTGTVSWTTRTGTNQTFTAESSTTTIRLRLNTVVAFGGGNRTWTGHNDNISVTITHSASGPSNDQLLRHGTWFDSGVEQPMTF